MYGFCNLVGRDLAKAPAQSLLSYAGGEGCREHAVQGVALRVVPNLVTQCLHADDVAPPNPSGVFQRHHVKKGMAV